MQVAEAVRFIDANIADAKAKFAAGQWEPMLEVEERRNALRNLAHAQGKAGDMDAARATISKIKRLAELLDDDSLGRRFTRSEWLMMSGWVQQEIGELDEARRTADAIKDPTNKNLAVAELAKAFAKSGRMESARELAAEALRVAHEIPNDDRPKIVYPEVHRVWAFERGATAQAEAGEIEGALKTADSIRDIRGGDQGVWDCLGAWRDIAFVLLRAGKVKEAMEIAKRVRALPQLPPPVSPAAVEFALVEFLRDAAMIQADKHDVDGAFAILDEFPRGGPYPHSRERHQVFVRIARACARSGDLNGIRRAQQSLPEDTSWDHTPALLSVYFARAVAGTDRVAARKSLDWAAKDCVDPSETPEHLTNAKAAAFLLIAESQPLIGDCHRGKGAAEHAHEPT